ncbi:hypothetical protein COU57_03385 [Candidatus Pacearchaeota archaeon CG10_big_fil_rev_8_21_14_0_10_32_14]|nr:MAG: hypothetical protein COU57_03385 [Candidatus Pacearchaeota archaeon CG10_big_fil_rev_8_21_14_0_10_32_14]
MENLVFRTFKKKDSRKVSEFIIKIFKEFNGKHLTKESVKFFVETYNKENIEKKWLKNFVIISEINDKIIGVGRAKKDGWITHCYVDKRFMRKGIGSVIINNLENSIKKNKIFLNSSPYALKFYRKLGYKRCGNKKLYNGIPLYPMIKKLD